MNNDNQSESNVENQIPLNQPKALEPEEIYLASSIPLVERSTLFDFMLSSQEKTNLKTSSDSKNESGLDGGSQLGAASAEAHLINDVNDDVSEVSLSHEAMLAAGKAKTAKDKTAKDKVELEEHLKMLCDAELLEQIQNIPRRISFKIGEVADLVGVKSFVLRFWETEFDLLKPKKASNNQRMYSRKDVEVSFLIKKLLYRDRFSIEGARNVMKQARLQMKAEVSKLEEGPSHKHKFVSVSANLKGRIAHAQKDNESATQNNNESVTQNDSQLNQFFVESKDLMKLHLQVDRISEQVKNLKQLFT